MNTNIKTRGQRHVSRRFTCLEITLCRTEGLDMCRFSQYLNRWKNNFFLMWTVYMGVMMLGRVIHTDENR